MADMKFKFDQVKDGFSQGLLTKFVDCREKVRLFLHRYKNPEADKRESLLYGDAVHYILEGLYHGVYTGYLKRAPAKKLQYHVRKLSHKWMSKHLKLTMDADTITLVSDLAEAVMMGYLKQYQDDFNKVNFLGAESIFSFQHLTSWGQVKIVGKRDAESVTGKNKTVILWEHKTKGQIDEATLSDSLTFNFQNLLYLWSLTKELLESGKRRKGYRVNNVRYNIIRKPQIRQKQSETYNDFIDRVAQDSLERPNFYFVRHDLTYTKDVQEGFAQELDDILREFCHWLQGQSPHYKNTMACSNRKFNCDFLPACASGSTKCLIKRRVLYPELEER